MQQEIVIISFYHFTDLHDYEALREPMLAFCIEKELKGTVLLASEGINATVSGLRADIDAYLDYLKQDPRFAALTWKENFYHSRPFEKMKVRLKQEAIRFAQDNVSADNAGEYVTPEEWDAFISRDDVALIDTRNEYETRIGSFEGAIDPDTKNFRDFADWAKKWSETQDKNTKVAMFCTGGVRCEKSTAYMKTLGFDDVYHLEGGILGYFDKTKNQNGKWHGECFVFDDRAAVDASLQPTGKLICRNCSTPVSADDLKHGPKGKVWCSECIEDYRETVG